MPTQLFKYRRWSAATKHKDDGTLEQVNYTEKLLLGHALYCQQPRGFDDPHDSHTGAVATGSVHDIDRYALENMGSVAKAMKDLRLTSLTQLASSSTPESRTALASIAGRNARRCQFILSLSGVGDDDLMWSFYADEHRGICLEFDGDHPCFSEIREVRYGASPPAQTESAIGANDPLAFHKSLSWAFQKEWRMISGVSSFSFPPETLRRVILGYRFTEAAFEELCQVLVEGCYKVVVDQMQRQADSYSLIPVRRATI